MLLNLARLLRFGPLVAIALGFTATHGHSEIVVTGVEESPDAAGASTARTLAPRVPVAPRAKVVEQRDAESFLRIVPSEASGAVLLADADGIIFARYPLPATPGAGARALDIAVRLPSWNTHVLMGHELGDGRRSPWRTLAIRTDAQAEEIP